MKYAVYMNEIDGTKDSLNFSSATERDIFIKNAKTYDRMKDIAYAPIYASG